MGDHLVQIGERVPREERPSRRSHRVVQGRGGESIRRGSRSRRSSLSAGAALLETSRCFVEQDQNQATPDPPHYVISARRKTSRQIEVGSDRNSSTMPVEGSRSAGDIPCGKVGAVHRLQGSGEKMKDTRKRGIAAPRMNALVDVVREKTLAPTDPSVAGQSEGVVVRK
jgi:hypothetical protein